MSGKTTLTILSSIIVICVAIDKFLLIKHKGKLYLKIEGWWLWLSYTRFNDLPSKVAKISYNKTKSFFPKIGFNLNFILKTLLISIIFSYSLIILGHILNGRGLYNSIYITFFIQYQFTFLIYLLFLLP